MESWERKGRPALIAALELACDKIGQDIESEIRQKEEAQNTSLEKELQQLRDVASRAEVLEQENRTLRQELEQLRQKHVKPPILTAKYDLNTPVRRVLGEVSPNRTIRAPSTVPSTADTEHPDWEKNYGKLWKRKEQVEERLKKVQESYDTAREVSKVAREERDTWISYAEALERKITRLETQLEQQDGDIEGPAVAQHDTTREAQETRPGSGLNSLSNPESGTRLGNADGDAPTERRAASASTINQSQLRGWVASVEQGPPPGEDAVDEPAHPDEALQLPPLPPCKREQSPVTVKQEPSSDGPIIVSERNLRKRKHASDHQNMPPPSRKIKTEASSDPVIMGEAAVFSPHESIDLDEGTNGMPTPRKQRSSWRQSLREDEDTTLRADTTSRLLYPRTMAEKTTAVSMPSLFVVDSIEHPQHNVSEFSRISGKLHAQGAARSVGPQVADIAEDGCDEYFEPRRPTKPPRNPPGKPQTLLAQGSSESEATPLRPARPTDSVVESPSTASRPQQGGERTHKPKTSRLRDKSLAQLRLDDFKVNPKLNKGFKHAFNEVVRGKADRAKLTGCNDYNCCGRHYRAVAESEFRASGPGVLSRTEGIEMMEEYLGPQAHKLAVMSREEQREVWMKAKSQQIANKFGRHRDRFERQPSPPGYWNPDMPTTQEIQENREEAARRERRQIEERWREAMKVGGGRWMFKDE
ncbi:DNA repair protein endonuclease SAE2/CtIP C-terminus-domain-containing protein [Triangularia verruculosa]|uniref:DNA repair protein endonuclease SAE2/CtIP C-terminus-domain-containing protein n=1 Tax=Triangularia verruculosa TaxID=2587418 RepID=A0AAN7AWX1_9PEZI|nr:DNA repair protein endonuclease SAE2/CtIP C-terminus-domain-containing protein [Triangularia verruculosa]